MLNTRLFEVADARGIRYKWIAGQLGYSPEYLSRIKHGAEPITDEFRRRACRLFADVDPEYLFFAPGGSSENHRFLNAPDRASEVPA